MAQAVKTNLKDKKKSKSGINNERSKATKKRLKIYNQKPIITKKGKIAKKQPKSFFISSEVPDSARIPPDRRWFGNTRVIDQTHLDEFREAMSLKNQGPFKVVLKRQKLPISLLEEPRAKGKVDLLGLESFAETFGPKATRKKPKALAAAMSDFAARAAEKSGAFAEASAETAAGDGGEDIGKRHTRLYKKVSKGGKADTVDEGLLKGHSKRLWGELHKVIDSSDVVLQVLDARDPMGTRSRQIEKQFRQRECHKNFVFVLNKCDLVPKWVVARWVTLLSKEFPTIAFHASATKPFGKGALIKLLRQYAALHSDRKQISVGLIGYPNVGKSSVINSLKSRKVCKVAPVPGETKVWQYVTLFKRIYLIDCPGVVSANANSAEECVLRSVVRVESVDDPAQYVPFVLQRVKSEFLRRAYGEFPWSNAEEFLTGLARRCGKLLKGGEPDFNNCAKMVLHDWQKGKLAWFVGPPKSGDEEPENSK